MEYFITALYAYYDDWGPVSQYMLGETSPYSSSNQFVSLFITTIIVNIVCIVIYEYLKLRFQRYYNLLLGSLYVIVGSSAFIIGRIWLMGDYYNGLMVIYDQSSTQLKDLNFSSTQFNELGWNNLFISLLTLLIFLTILKTYTKIYLVVKENYRQYISYNKN